MSLYNDVRGSTANKAIIYRTYVLITSFIGKELHTWTCYHYFIKMTAITHTIQTLPS